MSDVWDYFIKIGDKSKCKLCGKELTRTDGSTSGMRAHLKSYHEESKKTGSSKEKIKQRKITDNFAKTSKVNEKEAAEETLMRIMLRKNNAFTFVEDVDVKSLISAKFPNVQIGGEAHFRRIVMPRMADSVRKRIQEKVGKSFYAVTSDGWSQPSRSPHAHLQSLTIHIIAENFQRIDLVIAVASMGNQRATGENIAEKIEENLSSYDFDISKLACIVRDDASSMILAANLLEKESFQCSCHFLHLCMTKALKIPIIEGIQAKVESWVRFLPNNKWQSNSSKTPATA